MRLRYRGGRPAASDILPALIDARCEGMDGTGGMEDREALEILLSDLRSEHRDLDDVIERLAEALPFDQLRLQRLKKRKLQLRDRIQQAESSLYPDIIA